MAFVSTTDLFRNLVLPDSGYPKKRRTKHTPVADIFRVLFGEFQIVDWPNFSRSCCSVFEGTEEKALTTTTRQNIRAFLRSHQAANPARAESSLSLKTNNAVLLPVSTLQELDPSYADHRWTQGPANLVYPSTITNKHPDFVFSDSSCSIQAPAVAEVKPPEKADLLNSSPSNIRTMLSQAMTVTDGPYLPYLQLFSYMLGSTKGIGALTNYEYTRFFRLNLQSKKIEVSPYIHARQLRTEDGTCHPYQAWLFVSKLEANSAEFSSELVKRVFNEAEDGLDGWRQRQKDVKKAGKRKRGGSSSSNVSGREGVAQSTAPIDVTHILMHSSEPKLLGDGLAGLVLEREYKGRSLAFKAASLFVPEHDADAAHALNHIEHEIFTYEMLDELQGKVIPRMIGWGEETAFHPEYLFLVLEKVGQRLSRKKGELHVGGKELSAENVRVLKEKALESLAALHAEDVAHGDVKLGNLRVDMKDGRVDRVWIIDLGLLILEATAEEQLLDRRRLVRELEDKELDDTDGWVLFNNRWELLE